MRKIHFSSLSVILLVTLMFSGVSMAQVTYLAAGSSTRGPLDNYAEFNFVIPDGTSLLVVGVTDGVSDRAPVSATVGGLAMTLAVTGHFNDNPGGHENGALFYRVNPPTNNQTIRVTWNDTLRCKTIGAVALGNVNTTDPVIATKTYFGSSGTENGTSFSESEAPVGSYILSSCGGRFAEGLQYSTDVQIRGAGHVQVYANTAEDGFLAYWRHRGVMGRMPMTSAGTDQIRNWAEWNWGAAAMSVRPANGTLTVNITPGWAPTAGAQWSVDGGGTWNNSGASLSLFPGEYTVTFADWAGINKPEDQIATISSNTTTTITGDYSDTVAPTGSIEIDGGAIYANSLTVTLSLSAGDDGSGMDNGRMRFSNDGANWSTWEIYNTERIYPMPAGTDGVRNVYVQYRDAALNVSQEVISDSIIIDRQPPTVTVDNLLSSTSTPTLTGAVLDSLSGVASVEITVGGVDYTATVDNSTWSASITTPLADGVYDVIALATDNAGNSATDTSVNELTIDTERPTCTIDTSNYPSGNTESVPVVFTLTFSEPVSVFTADDLVTTNTTAVNVSGAGTSYTIQLWPASPDIVSCMLPENTVFDTAGNGNEVSNTAEVNFISFNPVCNVSGPVAYTNNPAVVLTIVFSPAVGSLDIDDIIVSNCTKVSLSGSGTLFSLTVTAIEEGPLTCRVPAGVAFDASTGTLPNLDSNMVAIIYDITRPTADIALIGATPTTSSILAFRTVFSEDIGTSFNASDVAFVGSLAPLATITGMTRSGNTYTITANVSNQNANGTLGITVGPNVQDFAGNLMAEAAASPLYRVRNWFGFTSQPASRRAYVGDAHTFTVSASFGEGSPTYQWWKRTANKAEEPVPGAIAPSLTLTGLTETDAGNYWCELTYDGEIETSNEATLEVEQHLQIITQPEGGEAFIGAAFTFSVQTSGGYEPVSYEWKKNGVAVLDAPNAEAWTLSGLNESDSGNYSVVVSDSYLDVVESQQAALLVTENPVPVSGLTGLLVASAAISCLSVSRILRKRKHS